MGVEAAGIGRGDGIEGGAGQRALVRAEIVQDDDLTWVEARGEDALGVGDEGRPVDAPGIATAGPMPSGVRAARSVTFGPWLRGVRPTARSPRGARARRRVIAMWVLVSSTKTKSAGLSAATSSRQAARAASSRSAAMSDFF